MLASRPTHVLYELLLYMSLYMCPHNLPQASHTPLDTEANQTHLLPACLLLLLQLLLRALLPVLLQQASFEEALFSSLEV
jgi:hypothetical protein